MSDGLTVGLLQYAPRFGHVGDNRARALSALADTDAKLIVLPELAFTGYSFTDREEAMTLAEPADERSETVAALTDWCRDGQRYLVTGFAERDGDRLYNSALLIGPDGPIDCYRKLHLFNTETAIFDAGDRPLAVHEVAGIRVGMMVCFDWAFPEVARTLMLRGAQVLCHPSNLVLTFCQAAMITRSLENRVFAITANRTGEDRRPHGTVAFTGQSQITSPQGERLVQCSADEDELRTATLRPELADNKLLTPANDVVRDRRPDFYI